MEGLCFWRVIKTSGELVTCNYFINKITKSVLFSNTSTKNIHGIIALWRMKSRKSKRRFCKLH